MWNIKKTKIKNYISLIIILCLMINLTACNKKEANTKEKKLNIYVDVKDKHSQNVIKFFIDEYKKEQPKTNIIVNNSMGTDAVDDISKGNVGDVLFISRNKMMELKDKGLLSDLSSYYDKNKINENYYNVMNSYGRYSDQYYGIGIMPYTLEIFYNKEALKKINAKEPKNIKDGDNILAMLNKQSIRVPVILTEDIDINNAIASLMMCNKKNVYNVDSIYNSSKEAYKNKQEFQSIFDNIQALYKSGVVNKNTFEIGNENTIKSFVNGDIPLIVSVSYYYKQLNNKDVGIIEDYSSIACFKGNVPIIVNTLLCVPINKKNGEEVNEFIKFVLNEKSQKKMLEKGFITGNMKVNEEIKGLGKSIVKHLKDGNENNILFLYNIPEKFYTAISSKIEKVLSGQYNGKEWTNIVDEIFKYK